MYEVIVGNIGKVHEGNDRPQALDVYREYVRMSQADRGRASGEGVTLWRNGEPIEHYPGLADLEYVVKDLMDRLRK